MIDESDENLWNRIVDFQLDDEDSSFSFTDRLCRENGWKYKYAVRVIQEYKKFMFLICVSDFPLTPSDQVDQVWHLHLLYTRSYWIEFCGKTLNKDIHHGPTKGGSAEKVKFDDWYLRTKELYQEVFLEHSPEDIWPTSEIRFGKMKFKRVDLHKNWIIPKLFKL